MDPRISVMNYTEYDLHDCLVTGIECSMADPPPRLCLFIRGHEGQTGSLEFRACCRIESDILGMLANTECIDDIVRTEVGRDHQNLRAAEGVYNITLTSGSRFKIIGEPPVLVWR